MPFPIPLRYVFPLHPLRFLLLLLPHPLSLLLYVIHFFSLLKFLHRPLQVSKSPLTPTTYNALPRCSLPSLPFRFFL
jgi:hypothetical protein